MDKGKQYKKRPTASVRKAREQAEAQARAEAEAREQAEAQAQAEAEAEAEAETGNQNAEDMLPITFPCPGGPLDASVLPLYPEHIAARIWEGRERTLLKVLNHVQKLLDWKIRRSTCSQQWQDLYTSTQLYQLKEVSYPNSDKVLINAFVERWHPETNTFHMPFGEMTITLDDVFCLTGLPIDGKSIFLEGPSANMTFESTRHEVATYLGVSPAEAMKAMDGARGGSVKLEWLRHRFATDGLSEDPERLACCVRAYLLYTLGCTIFADKSGTRVSTAYLRFLIDLDAVHTYSWGSAALAFLYKHLGSASQVKTRQMAGYSTLFEAWIYERFPALCPPPNVHYYEDFPLARRWEHTIISGVPLDRLQGMREQLDALRADDVIWMPYTQQVRQHFPFHRISLYQGCIGSVDHVEPYHPDRVLRQFGYVQTIPGNVIAPDVMKRSLATSKRILATMLRYFAAWKRQVLTAEDLGRQCERPWDCAPDYMEWYTRVSHPIICNPEHHSLHHRTAPDAGLPDPWSMVSLARGLLEPMAMRSFSGDECISYDELTLAIEGAYVALGGQQQAGPSTNFPTPEEPSSRRRRRNT